RLDLLFEMIQHHAETNAEERAPILQRLAEVAGLMLIEYSLRGYQRDGLNTGFGINDARIRAVLTSIHQAPERDWTLGLLAEEANLSRSSFAQRFRSIVGQTPVDYVLRVRMAQACRQLRRTVAPISEIAYGCGYSSDAAFHKAFKRMVGVSPARYRNQEKRRA
ncbi:MAG: AraC family transcriptional regulator, partial [Pseudomonadota bacterium]